MPTVASPPTHSPPPLSSTLRTRLNRVRDRARLDRRELHDVLGAALVCHLGVPTEDGAPLVLPTAFAVDLDGPDAGGTLYLHGSVAARSLRLAGHEICVTVTMLDGLVLARSGFHHSMNYRSAVVIGRARAVHEPDEKRRALDLVVDHMVPGRSSSLRPPTRKELAATLVVALPLAEASVKARSGDPVDDESDVEHGGWAGVIPLRLAAGPLVTASDAADRDPPRHVDARLAGLT